MADVKVIEPHANANLIHKDQSRNSRYTHSNQEEFTCFSFTLSIDNKIEAGNNDQKSIGRMHLHKKEIERAKGDDYKCGKFNNIHPGKEIAYLWFDERFCI